MVGLTQEEEQLALHLVVLVKWLLLTITKAIIFVHLSINLKENLVVLLQVHLLCRLQQKKIGRFFVTLALHLSLIHI